MSAPSDKHQPPPHPDIEQNILSLQTGTPATAQHPRMNQRADSAYSEMEIPNGLQIEPAASPASSELSSSAPHAYCSDMDPLVKQALESGDRMKERPLSMGEPGEYLDNLDRFLQTNYECSFCPMEQPTFEDMLKHIKIKHPWYDLKIHENIR